MADYKIIIPFIHQAEGGLSDNPNDKAALNKCPFPYTDGKFYHTNKGWTWYVWTFIFGVNQGSATRFYAMTDEDWGTCFKKLYWDKMCGDLMDSQRIANQLADAAFNAGCIEPGKEVQEILNTIFNDHLQIDGIVGPDTVKAVNTVTEYKMYDAVCIARCDFYKKIVAKDASQSIYLNGWLGRVANLIAFNEKITPHI